MTDEIKADEPTPTPLAINNIRTNKDWYNGLVDDNGTGGTGTIWNKAEVANSLYAVDLGFMQLDNWGQWIDIPFNAANFSATGGTWTVGAPAIVRNRYAAFGKTVHWSLYLSWFSGNNVVGGTPASINIFGLPWALAGAQTQIVDYQGGVADVGITAGMYASSSSNGVSLSKANGAPFAAGTVVGMITTMTFEIL